MSGLFNPTVAWITLRATLSRKRALLFAIPAVILILFTVALRASRAPMRPWPSHVLGTFGFSVLIPLTALIIGTSVLGAEIDDGSIVHLLATPVRRSSVVMTKFVIATGLTMIFAAIPELIAALIAGGGVAPAPAGTGPGPGFVGLVSISSGKLALGLFVGALACSVIYNAVFVMVSVATTRAIAVGLLYVLVWETLLSNFVSGVKLLSVSHYGLGIANGFANDSALQAGLTVATSVVMGVIVTGRRPGRGGEPAVVVHPQGRARLTAYLLNDGDLRAATTRLRQVTRVALGVLVAAGELGGRTRRADRLVLLLADDDLRTVPVRHHARPRARRPRSRRSRRRRG